MKKKSKLKICVSLGSVVVLCAPALPFLNSTTKRGQLSTSTQSESNEQLSDNQSLNDTNNLNDLPQQEQTSSTWSSSNTTCIRNNATEINLGINKLPSQTGSYEMSNKLIKDGWILNTQPGVEVTSAWVNVNSTDYNDVEGYKIVNVVVGDRYGQKDGVPAELIFWNIKITGFATMRPTEYASNRTIVLDKPNEMASSFTKADIENYIGTHMDLFFINIVHNTTINEHIRVHDDITTNDGAGTLTVTIGTLRYLKPDGHINWSAAELNWGAQFTFTGFKQFTTCLKDNVTQIHLPIPKTPTLVTEEELKIKLIEGGWIINTIPGKTIEPKNLNINKSYMNDVLGTLTIRIFIDRTVAIRNGYANDVVIDNIKILGLETLLPTNYSPIKNINANFSDKLASEATPQLIKSYVKDHMGDFFTNMAANTTIDDVIIHNDIRANTSDGSINVTIGLNKYLSSDGNYYNKGPELLGGALFTISGFATNTMTTHIKNNATRIDLGISNKTAIQVEDDEIILKLIQGNWIVDTQPGIILSTEHIKIHRNRIDPEQIDINITIYPPAALENGVSQSVSFYNITLVGFKHVLITSYNETRMIDDNFNDKTVNDVTTAFITNYVSNHMSAFFNNMLENTTINDVVVHDDLTLNHNNGTVTLTIGLNKYMTSDGNEHLTGPELLGGARFTFSGFNNSSSTTHIKNDQSSINLGINYKTPMQVTELELKEKLIEGGWIVDTKHGIALSPEHLTIHKDNIGLNQLQVTITIDKAIGLQNGLSTQVVIPNITLIGFKQTLQTSYVQNRTIVDTFDNKHTSEVTTEYIQQYVANHLEKFFNNATPGTSLDDIVVHNDINANPDIGTLTVTIGLNKYITSDGTQHNNGPELLGGVQFTFKGFRISNATTHIKDNLTKIDLGISKTTYDTTDEDIKQKLIDDGWIQDLQPDVTLTPSLITINRTKTSAKQIELSITINKTIALNNGNPAEVTFDNIVLVGFKKVLNTSYVKNNLITDDFSALYANQVDQKFIKQYVWTNQEKFITNIPSTATIDNIIVHDDWEVNVASGSVSVSIGINQYTDKQGRIINAELEPCHKWTFQGFNTNAITTILTNSTIDSGLSATPATYAAEYNINNLRQAVLLSGYVQGLQINKTLGLNNIKVVTNKSLANDIEGTLKATITISKDVAWNEGIPTDMEFQVLFSGFKKTIPTQFSHITNVTISGELTKLPSISVTPQDIKKYIMQSEENKTQFFSGLVKGFNYNDFDVTIVPNSANVENGTLQIEITLKRYISPEDGQEVTNGSWKCPVPYTLSGFKVDGNTSFLPSNLELKGVYTLLASSIENSSNPSLRWAVLDAIRNNIMHLPPGKNAQLITDSDFDLSIIPDSIDNTIGMISVNITIKNNYWQTNAKVEPVHIINNVILTGFKTIKPTMKDNIINELAISWDWQNKYSTSFHNNDAQLFLQSKLYEIFNGTAPDHTQVVIVENTPYLSLGKASVRFKLSKYYDNKGLLQQTPSHEFTITITGFKSDGLTTTLKSNIFNLNGVSNIQAKSISDQFSNKVVTTAILNALKLNVLNLADGASSSTLTDKDIIFAKTYCDSLTGTMIISLSIINNKAWSDGLVSEVYFSNITLKGFKINEPTGFVKPNAPLKLQSSKQADKVTDEELKRYILSYRDNFFVNLPSSGIQASDFSVLRRNGNGWIIFSIQLNKYINDKGEEVSYGEPLPNSPQWALVGFSKIEGTEYCRESRVKVNSALAKMNTEAISDETIKSFIIANKEKFFTNLPPDGIQNKDLRIYDRENNINFITFNIELSKFIDPITGMTNTSGVKRSPYKFILEGFNTNPTDNSELTPDAQQEIVNKDTFGSANVKDLFRDDFIRIKEKKRDTETKLKIWIQQHMNQVFKNILDSTKVLQVYLTPTDRDCISVNVELSNLPATDGSIYTGMRRIDIHGFKPTPPKIDITTDFEGTRIRDKIPAWIKINQSASDLKDKIYWDVNKKINFFLKSNKIPEFWKTILSTVERSMIVDNIVITQRTNSTNQRVISSVVLISTTLPKEIQECISGMIDWQLQEHYEGIIKGSSNAKSWTYAILIISGLVIVNVLVILIVAYRKKKNRSVNEDFFM